MCPQSLRTVKNAPPQFRHKADERVERLRESLTFRRHRGVGVAGRTGPQRRRDEVREVLHVELADGRMLEVKDALSPSSPAYATLKGLRGSACGYFTTVLGPGANAAHETHFHFDAGKHGRSENYRICE